MFTDTMFANTASRQGNKCAQVFSTSNGWVCAYPMKKKSEAHEALSLLLQHEGVLNMMTMDGALKQLKGKFCKKCREVDSHVKQLKPHTPWLNAAESVIHELKHGFGRQMVWSGAPKCLWDHCLK